ncbi:MAG: 2OG-Fe(II) oxygenase [Caulobacteraceae bacterium]|nr:2OG-Fe(II) oxygenase [Caulobacteraceae bacterium]
MTKVAKTVDAVFTTDAYRLSDDLDLVALRAAFEADGRLQIRDVLDPLSAQALAAALDAEEDWLRSVRLASGSFSAPLRGRAPVQPLHAEWIAEARVDPDDPAMQYMFDVRRLSAERAFGLERGDQLNAFYDFVNGPEFLAFGAALTGEHPVACEAQATRYRRGDLLTLHSDRDSHSRRTAAWVFNLSREWRPEWGGLLLFHEGSRIVDGFSPLFNSLSLFRVPMDHSVTQVTDFAPRDRLAISGWYLRAE